jgi:hypothetical protein
MRYVTKLDRFSVYWWGVSPQGIAVMWPRKLTSVWPTKGSAPRTQNPIITSPIFRQQILGRTNRLLSLKRHGPHWKRRVQQFFYRCLCIRYRGNVSTEPLPSNDRGDTQTHTQTATCSHKPTLLFQSKESMLKNKIHDSRISYEYAFLMKMTARLAGRSTYRQN